MPLSWDTDAFLFSLDKLKKVVFENLYLAHFGCIYGIDATLILDEVMETFYT